MTCATIEPSCKKHIINIGSYDGFRVCLRKTTGRNISLYMFKNHHLCLVSKSNAISLNKAKEELKLNFKVVDNIVSDKHVHSFIKYENKPEKVQPQLRNKIVHDLETFNTIKCVLYANCKSRLSKSLGEYFRDITQREYEKGRNDCTVFKGSDDINELLDYVSHFEGEAKRVNNKVVKYKLCLLVQSGSDFDSYVVLNNLLQWTTFVSLIRKDSIILTLKMFSCYVDQNKKFLNLYVLGVVEFILKLRSKK